MVILARNVYPFLYTCQCESVDQAVHETFGQHCTKF